MRKAQLHEFIESKIESRKVLVLGLGVQGGGLGVVRYLLRHRAKVSIFDDKTEQDLKPSLDKLHLENASIDSFYFGGDKPRDLSEFSLVIKGPSFKWDHPLVKCAIDSRVDVMMETSIFIRFAPCKVIGITGTRGKSTTTMMIYDVLSKLYTEGRVYVSGNIPGTCALEILDCLNSKDIVVLELSSWQLSGCHKLKCSPQIAVLTNIYEDHMNYYANMQDYIYDKTAIYAYQKPLGQTNGKIIVSEEWANKYFAVTAPPQSSDIILTENNTIVKLSHLKGEHNVHNAILAKRVSELILGEVDSDQISAAVESFKSLSCRQEHIARCGNIDIINDSTSTTPVAAIIAMRTFADRDIYLVLGGNTKHLDTRNLLEEISRESNRIKHITLLSGSFTNEIYPELKLSGVVSISSPFSDFDKALRDVFAKAKSSNKPSVILFSPGATSFAQFRNEFHRGEEFTRIISDIIAG